MSDPKSEPRLMFDLIRIFSFLADCSTHPNLAPVKVELVLPLPLLYFFCTEACCTTG